MEGTIFLQEEPHLHGIAAEYGVLQIHMGELSQTEIRKALEGMAKAEPYDDEVKEILALTAEARRKDDWDSGEHFIPRISALRIPGCPHQKEHTSVQRIGPSNCELK